VVDEKDPTIQMQEMLRQMGQDNIPEIKPILEINPTHPIVKKLEEIKDDNAFEEISRLLLEQALLIEGVEIKNPANFVKRINSMMQKAL
jgi:molecular chaperone HtpG